MKSLLDIQQEVRRLENSVRDIGESIKNIYSDIDELRNADNSTDIDFSKIEVLAGRFGFRQHPLAKLEDGRLCQLYLEMLLNIVRLDPERETVINRLVFIQWLQIQANIDWTLERLYADCFRMDREEYYEFADGFTRKYRESFIVDALITAYIAGALNQDIMEYITEQGVILGVNRERLRILSVTARVILCQSIRGMRKSDMDEFLKCVRSYRHYVDGYVIEETVKNLRDIAVEARDEDCLDFVWIVQQMSMVKKGDVIAVCKMKVRSQSSSFQYVYKELKATSAGMLFQFRDQKTYYGVIGHESDNKEAIKAWVRSGRCREWI